MGVQATDLVMVERGAAQHKTTAGEIAALGGGGGAGINIATAQVDFGTVGDYAEVVVAAPWVAAGMTILAQPALPTTADHDPEDAVIEGLVAAVVAIDPGTGFTLGVSAPHGAWGRFDFNCMGVL